MELTEFTTAETADIAIVSPRTALPTDFVVTIHGVYSKKFRPVYSDFVKRAGGEACSILDLDAKAMAALTDGWQSLTSGGKAVRFSPEKAEQIYSDNPYILNQLVNKIAAGSDFLPEA